MQAARQNKLLSCLATGLGTELKITNSSLCSPNTVNVIELKKRRYDKKSEIHIAHLTQRCHNSKFFDFSGENFKKVSQCYNFL